MTGSAGFDLEDRTIVVTGAAGDLGAAVTRAVLAQGARVLATDRDADALERLVDACPGDADIATCTADVRDEADVIRYVAAAVERWGGVDGCFNNAGIEGRIGTIESLPVEALDEVLAVNVRGVFLCLKHVLAVMRDGGSVVNTASTAGHVAAASMAPYVASKHAVIGLTKAAALEVADRNIRVNAVCPGPLRGRMMSRIDAAGVTSTDTERGTRPARIPLGRYGEPEEIAELVTFLLSPRAAYVTGASYLADGGRTIG